MIGGVYGRFPQINYFVLTKNKKIFFFVCFHSFKYFSSFRSQSKIFCFTETEYDWTKVSYMNGSNKHSTPSTPTITPRTSDVSSTDKKSIFVSGGKQLLATTSSQTSPLHGPTSQPLCLYCGIKGCQSKLCKEKLILHFQLELLNDGHIKDERRTVGTNCKDGKSDQRNQSGANVKGDGKDLDVDRSKKLNKFLKSLSGASLEEAITLYRKRTLGPGNIGVRYKAYRFASEDRTVRPWSLYAAWTRWAPLAARSTAANGVGWFTTGQTSTNAMAYISQEVALSLDNIPQVNPASTGGQMARISNSIFIRKVYGKIMIRRNPIYPGTTGLGAVVNITVLQNAPRYICYLQRCPVNLASDVDPTVQAYQSGLINVAGCSLYPAPFTTSGSITYSPAAADFICYYNGTAPTPRLDNTVTTWSPPNAATADYASIIHRSPNSLAEVISLKTGHHPITGFSQPPGSISATVDPNLSLHTNWTYPEATVYEIPIEHTFKGKGLHVRYMDQAVAGTSVAAINQLRLKYWQDTTGTFWTQSSATSNAIVDTSGYTEHIAYEVFVEFEDGRDDDEL